jgi:hypothetical protein
MLTFVFDQIDRPNLTRWTAAPLTPEWREFDHHWPYTVPLRLLLYFDWAGIDYCCCSTYDDAPGWYPVGIGWFDHRIDYFGLMSDRVHKRLRDGSLSVLFYYHEGDNPAVIQNRLRHLAERHNLPEMCYLLISANSAAESLPQSIYFDDHELFFNYVNRAQAADPLPNTRDYQFTLLNRTHKQWRASVVTDLWRKDLLNDSLWSYLSVSSDPEDQNPIESDSHDDWKQAVNKFLAGAPYRCDQLSVTENNNHHWVNNNLYTQSWCHIVIETHFDADGSQGSFVTEKTWKCIKYGQPFVIAGTPGSIAALRDKGYRVYDQAIDHSYDEVSHNTDRWNHLCAVIKNMHGQNWVSWWQQCQDDAIFNQQHFVLRPKIALNNLIEQLSCNQ